MVEDLAEASGESLVGVPPGRRKRPCSAHDDGGDLIDLWVAAKRVNLVTALTRSGPG